MRFTKILSVCFGLVFIWGLQANGNSVASGIGDPLQRTRILADGSEPLPPPSLMADGSEPLPPPSLMADGSEPLPPPSLMADGSEPLPIPPLANGFIA